MTTIFTLGDSSIQPTQREDTRPLAQDFAHELAKPAREAKPAWQGQTKATPNDGAPGRLPAGTPESAPSTAIDEVPKQLEVLADVMQQVQAAEHITTAPIGVTEALLGARVFGWHAMAQAYLSELSIVEEVAGVRDGRTAAEIVARASTDTVNPPSPLTVVVPPGTAVESESATQADIPIRSAMLVLPEETAPVPSAALAVTDSSAPGFWLERSLRFIRQRDGSSVAWLRDFRLDDAEASNLIKLVLSDAREKGVVISRIMLNGREVWTSPNTI